MLTYWDGSVGLYSVSDSSVMTLSELGLVPHPRVVDLSAPGEFYITLSEEVLTELDADILFWYYTPENLAPIEGLAARAVMRAPAEGREVFLSTESLANGALSHGSLLSLPAAFEVLEPAISAALDGDPATDVVVE